MIDFYKRLVLVPVLIFSFFIIFSQETQNSPAIDFISIYNETIEKQGADPLLHNGVYYDNIYQNAEGHPFLMDGQFHKGDIVYRNKKYYGTGMKYDIYNQQIIINQDDENHLLVNLLANELVSEFNLNGQLFKRLSFTDEESLFYQVIYESEGLSCYYFWHKTRSEKQNVGEYLKYVFSDKKSKKYLLVHDELLRFRNNRSLIKLIPDHLAKQMKEYMKTRQISVDEADDSVMKDLMNFYATILQKSDN